MLELVLLTVTFFLIKKLLSTYNINSVASIFYSFLCVHWIFAYVVIYFLFRYLTNKYDFIHFEIESNSIILTIIITYGLFLCLVPVLFNLKKKINKSIEVKDRYKYILAIIFISSFYIGYKINIFGVGLNITTLPFRFNGIFEELLTLGISFYLLSIIKNKLLLFFVIITYSLLNLFLYGSKFYSLLPVLIILILNILTKNDNLFNTKKIIIFTASFFLIFYSFLNPFKFRTDLSKGDKLDFIASFSENLTSTTTSTIPIYDVVAIGIINIGYRLSGYETLTNARYVNSLNNSSIEFHPHKKLNLLLNNEEGTTSSTGFIGYYQIMFHSMFIGLFVSLIILAFVFFLFSSQIFTNNFIAEIILINYLQAFIDGPYFEGLLVKVLFNSLFIYTFFKIKTKNINA